ncbi:MAG: hypothetical protein ACRCVU_09050 [Flavobacterium sp.]
MEWNKIDKKWKEEMMEREIAPSAQAWDKLSAQLHTHRVNKNRSKVVMWLGIAASLFIGGFSVIYFMGHDVDNQILPNITLPNLEKVVVEQGSTEEDTLFNQEEVEETISVPSITKDRTNSKVQEKNQQLVNNIKVDTINALKPTDLQEEFTEPVVNKPSKRIVVNSDDLLNQVEGEIEIEYRESVIKKIYDKTKKMIVERSN